MLLILTFLACITVSVAAEDIGATLKPYYEKLEKAVEKQSINDAVELYHSQGVIVKKGKYAVYGKEGITNDYEVVWKFLGRHNFTLSNQAYEGTDNYKIAEFDFEILSERVPYIKGRMLHIWKKEGETLRIYHEQFESKL
uniref:Nuclear transport factor 2 family protein n=1 Tax=Haemonchus contortus TaxID=6289 RepID=A0A7I4Y2F4_HAECO|nr:Protein Y105C5B.5 [Haemonchus contortus]